MSTSFANDIQPLFRPKDIICMSPHGIDLSSFEYMSDPTGNATHADYGNARDVLDRIDGTILPRMPKGAPPWTDSQIDLLRNWIAEGCPP
jgi:hypothetical protein